MCFLIGRIEYELGIGNVFFAIFVSAPLIRCNHPVLYIVIHTRIIWIVSLRVSPCGSTPTQRIDPRVYLDATFVAFVNPSLQQVD